MPYMMTIRKRRRDYPDPSNVEFASLAEYLALAERSIRCHAPKNVIHLLLSNEDAIADIAHGIMMADWRWNGTGNRIAYRWWCARLTVLRVVAKLTNTNTLLSLDLVLESGSSLHDFVSNDTITADEALTQKEYVQKLLQHLTPAQRDCIEHYFFGGMTYQEIGNLRNTSKQAAESNVAKGLETLYQIVSQHNG